MVLRILMLFLSLIILVNLCIVALCNIMGENLYKKYGKQMLIILSAFVFVVAALYVVVALVGLN